jgi:hypothetical protein
MMSSQKWFCYFITSKDITTVVCFFSVCEVALQLKMPVIEQHMNIKSCVLLQKSPVETLTML